MLENLTKKLIADDVEKHEKNVIMEGAVLAANMSQVERYSCINESVECDSIANMLDKVSFNDFQDSADRASALYEACMHPETLNETPTVVNEKKVKRLIMSKDDYDKIIAIVKEYTSKNDDDSEKEKLKKKIKSFVGTINSGITKADEVDTFVASVIRKIYNAFRSDRPMSGSDKATVMVNIRGIKDAF